MKKKKQWIVIHQTNIQKPKTETRVFYTHAMSFEYCICLQKENGTKKFD